MAFDVQVNGEACYNTMGYGLDPLLLDLGWLDQYTWKTYNTNWFSSHGGPLISTQLMGFFGKYRRKANLALDLTTHSSTTTDWPGQKIEQHFSCMWLNRNLTFLRQSVASSVKRSMT